MQLAKAALCQILAFFAVILLHQWLPPGNIDNRLYIGLQGLISMLLSIVLRQPVWWWLIQLVFAPAVAMMLAVGLPPWLYLLTLILLTLAFWGTVKGDVPLFLSSSAVNATLIDIINLEQAKRFAELGAGIGTVVAPLARRFPQLQIDALERAPLPWLLSYWRCRSLANVRIDFYSFWHRSLTEYDVVYGFLSPIVMSRIGAKVRREMREGSLFISSSFPVPNWAPERVVQLDDARGTRLYCYRILSQKLTS